MTYFEADVGIYLFQLKKAPRDAKYVGNDESLKRSQSCHFSIFRRGRIDLLQELRLRKKEYPESIICIKRRKRPPNLWTWRQSVVTNDFFRDFGPVMAFGGKVQVPVASQGSEGKKCRPLDNT